MVTFVVSVVFYQENEWRLVAYQMAVMFIVVTGVSGTLDFPSVHWLGFIRFAVDFLGPRAHLTAEDRGLRLNCGYYLCNNWGLGCRGNYIESISHSGCRVVVRDYNCQMGAAKQ